MWPVVGMVSLASHRPIQFADSRSVEDLRVDRYRVIVELCGQCPQTVFHQVPMFVIRWNVDAIMKVEAVAGCSEDGLTESMLHT